MIYALVRLYATHDVAAKAYALLEEYGLSKEENYINLVTPTSASSVDGLAAAIRDGGRVLASDAKVIAQSVAGGQYLVSLHPPFGSGRIYEDLLDDLGPVGNGVVEEREYLVWDEAAPFSSAFGFPVISKASPYQFMGLPAIAKSGATTSSWLGLGELADSNFSVFGTPRISSNPGPFSGLFKLPLLK